MKEICTVGKNAFSLKSGGWQFKNSRVFCFKNLDFIQNIFPSFWTQSTVIKLWYKCITPSHMSKYGPVPCQKIAIFDQKWLLWEFSLFKHIEWSSCSPALGNNHDNQKNHPSFDYIKRLLWEFYFLCDNKAYFYGRHPQVMVSSWMIFFQSKWDHIVYYLNNSLNWNSRTYVFWPKMLEF